MNNLDSSHTSHINTSNDNHHQSSSNAQAQPTPMTQDHARSQDGHDDSAAARSNDDGYTPSNLTTAMASNGANQDVSGNTAAQPEETDQEWPLKSIYWPPFSETPTEVKILMQDQNGPCSFLALCNVLLLRGDISLSLSLKSVKYSTLSALLADYLLRNTPSSPSPSNSLDFALNVLPKTLSGLDVNVDFISGTFTSSSQESSSSSNIGSELDLFKLANVDIKHGWMASKDDLETWNVLNENAKDYDTAVQKMVDGHVVAGGGITSASGDAQMVDLVDKLESEPEKQRTIYQASVIRRFLDASSTQLTYAGLFHLSETLPPSSLCALFRNSHFSVLYRRPNILPTTTSSNTTLPVLPQATLFHLVTDQALLYEPHAVWESLEDIDGAASRFYDASLQPARIRGDYVPRERKRSEERRREEHMHDADMALAAQMQQDEYDREQYHRDQASRQSPQQHTTPAPQTQPNMSSPSSSAPAASGGHRPENLHSKQLAGLGVKTKKETNSSSNTTTTKEGGKKSKKDCIIC